MLRKLLKIGRPHFLIIGLAVFSFGAAWAAAAGGPLILPRLVWGALVVLLAQLSVSYSNEYFDQEYDQPGSNTPFSGGSGVLQGHPEIRPAALRLALGLMTASLLAGVIFLIVYDLPLWLMLFVILGNLAGWYYSAPPLRLSASGWGEICYILILGLLVPGMGYLAVQGRLDTGELAMLVPLVFYSLASILVVELPDLEVDRAGGKKTWVVRWGRRFGLGSIGLLFLGSTAYFFSMPVMIGQEMPVDFRTLGFLSLLPLGAGLAGWLRRPLNRGQVVRSATWILVSLVLFVLMVDAYLIWVSMRY